VAALLAVGGSSAALAAPQAPQAPQAVAAPCDDLAARIAGVERLQGQLEALVARLEERLAAGGLRPWQRALVRTQVRALRNVLQRVEARLAQLAQQYGDLCGSGGSTEEAPPPPEEPPPPPQE
jgi:outer membrane protein TolC